MVSRMINRIGMTLAFLLITVVMFAAPADSTSSFRTSGDLDGDGKAEEYVLENHVLSVNEGSQMLWKTPESWHVDGFSLGDADNDGKANLVFSLWKTGSFGKSKPFWHDGEDVSYKNHLFVYKLESDGFKPVWSSSDLYRPILSFDINDSNGDGRNELVVREGQYKKVAGDRYTTDPGAEPRTTVWQWDEWGFAHIGL